MTTRETPIYRRGSKFKLTINLTDNNGAALDLDPADLVSQVYDKPDGTMLAELTVAAGSKVGEYVLSGTVDATEWPDEVVLNVFDVSDETDSTAAWVKVIGQLSRPIEAPEDEQPEEPGEPEAF
jgi:hypothetical protein